MSCLVFLVEGPSEREALLAWMPQLVPPQVQVRIILFDGKQDMEKRMVLKMRAWQAPNTRFIVLRDQDSAPCRKVKSDLMQRCVEAGRPDAIVRVACHELENFFLGDWQAVARAFDRPNLSKLANQAIYRKPDDIAAPAQELARHIPAYQKLDGARRIAPLMDLEANRSHSFRQLRDAIRAAGAALASAVEG